ncbi:Protein of unknown function [Pedococcus dokdonensis]|uniref:DUF3515 domain-containing protein n=1 Tax=Pedococcus dokdonensis TaxID=443156 RepID=A0A1H0LQ67_9MICO|nr:DUF3515 family protein [Pedococcus dokdonensis]SDO70161.1 Protein of unknown function [Pedococcus dokdonensis]
MRARLTAARPLRTTTAGLLVLGVAGGLLSGCSSLVEVSPPQHAVECEPATARWPAKVSGQASRGVDVNGGVASDAHAWGDPAIIATCGWPALGPTDKECLDVDGVDWVVEQLSDGARFTTYGREPAIEVLVPHAYAPEPLLLPAFGEAAGALPSNGRKCD